ncbi:hypothetical protein HZ326_24484 [Fusarium oxysporum f. sp. albedinis]|nr:hypothetical protein HZ326_24484 [Fusarium oxysporum f. sp. albedinis]
MLPESERSKKKFEIGVEVLMDYSNAREFFEGFNVSTNPSAQAATTSRFADFSTGRWKYVELAEKYEDLMLPGLWDLPNKVPLDLPLLGDLTIKHGIKAAVHTLGNICGCSSLDKHGRAVVSKFKYSNSFVGAVSSIVPLSTTRYNAAPCGDLLDYPELPLVEWYRAPDQKKNYSQYSLFAPILSKCLIQDLYSLQDHRSTWYTGAAWSSQLHTLT